MSIQNELKAYWKADKELREKIYLLFDRLNRKIDIYLKLDNLNEELHFINIGNGLLTEEHDVDYDYRSMTTGELLDLWDSLSVYREEADFLMDYCSETGNLVINGIYFPNDNHIGVCRVFISDTIPYGFSAIDGVGFDLSKQPIKIWTTDKCNGIDFYEFSKEDLKCSKAILAKSDIGSFCIVRR